MSGSHPLGRTRQLQGSPRNAQDDRSRHGKPHARRADGHVGFQGHADAASSPECPASVMTKFNIMLGQGIIKRIPPGCADALLHELYVEVYGQSEHLRTFDASLGTLQGRLDALVPAVADDLLDAPLILVEPPARAPWCDGSASLSYCMSGGTKEIYAVSRCIAQHFAAAAAQAAAARVRVVRRRWCTIRSRSSSSRARMPRRGAATIPRGLRATTSRAA